MSEQGARSWKRDYILEGRQEGLQVSIQSILEYRFGAEAQEMHSRLAKVPSVEELEELLPAALEAPSLEAFQEKLNSAQHK